MDNQNLNTINSQRLVELNRQNAQADAKHSNRTYDSEVKRFKNFVKSYPNIQSLAIPPPGYPTKFVSVNSITCYYLESMKFCKCSRGYAEKCHLALNKLATLEESLLAPDLKKHPDTGPVIETVLSHINHQDLDRKRKKALVSDPHDDNPTAVINQEEISRVLMVRLARPTNWLDSAVVWAVTCVTAARFNSVQRLCLDKMIIIKNLPPHGIETPHDGRPWDSITHHCDSRMLGFLVPPYDQLKRKKSNKRQEKKQSVLGPTAIRDLKGVWLEYVVLPF